MDSNLTADDFDWLRKLKTANSLGAFTITSKGRDELLDQDMRDAEDR